MFLSHKCREFLARAIEQATVDRRHETRHHAAAGRERVGLDVLVRPVVEAPPVSASPKR